MRLPKDDLDKILRRTGRRIDEVCSQLNVSEDTIRKNYNLKEWPNGWREYFTTLEAMASVASIPPMTQTDAPDQDTSPSELNDANISAPNSSKIREPISSSSTRLMQHIYSRLQKGSEI